MNQRHLLRLIAILRGKYPLIFITPAFVFFQAFSLTVLSSPLAWLAALLALLLLLPVMKSVKLLGAPVIYILLVSHAGSFNLSWLQDSQPELVENALILMVDGEIRHRRVGQLELPVLVRAVVDSNLGLVEEASPIRLLCKSKHLPWRNATYLKLGDEFLARISYSPILKSWNPFSYHSLLKRRGYAGTCRINYASRSIDKSGRGLLDGVKDSIVKSTWAVLGNNETSGLLLSMSIGSRDLVSSRTESVFQKLGLSHLMVVSGYQVTLLYYLVCGIVRWLLLLSRRLPLIISVRLCSALAALMTALLFVSLIGFDGSSVRALVALVFVVVSNSLDRGSGLLNSVLLSMLLVSIVWPGAILEPGVQLTFGALLGICLGLSGSSSSKLTRFVMINVYALVFTGAIVACWFEFYSIYGLFLNLTIAPILAFLSCNVGFLVLLLVSLGIWPGSFLMKVLADILVCFRDFLSQIVNWPLAYLQVTLEVRVLVLLVSFLVISFALRNRINHNFREVGIWVP